MGRKGRDWGLGRRYRVLCLTCAEMEGLSGVGGGFLGYGVDLGMVDWGMMGVVDTDSPVIPTLIGHVSWIESLSGRDGDNGGWGISST